MKTVKMTKEYSNFLVEAVLQFETVMSDINYLTEASSTVQSDLLEFDYGLVRNSDNVLVEADLNKTADTATKKLYRNIDKKKEKASGGAKTFLNKIASFLKKHWKALLGIAALGGGATLFGYVIKRGAVIGHLFNGAYSLKDNWESFENLRNTSGNSKGDRTKNPKSIYTKIYNFLRKVRDFIVQSYKAFKGKVKSDKDKASKLDKFIVSSIKAFNDAVLWVAKKFKGFKIPGLKSKTEGIMIQSNDVDLSPTRSKMSKVDPSYGAYKEELNQLK